jgi:glycosyltransferase involved in cell wall biosynthesis
MIVACIPAYNEEKSIARVVLTAQKYCDKVLVCDDGSGDMTPQIAESLGATVLHHSKNLGKGAALRDLFEASIDMGAKVVITIDGDGQHDADDIPAVLRPILAGDADVSIGTRFNGTNEIPLHRKVGNQILTFLTNVGATRKVEDTQSGFRAYSRKALEEIEVREDGMGVDSQILFEARKRNLRVSESGISVDYNGEGSTHHPVRHIGDVIVSMVRYAAEERPLLVLGLPALAVFGIGLVYGVLLLSIYANTSVFILAYALLAVSCILLGTMALLMAVVLFTLSNFLKRVKRANNGKF